MWTRQGDGLEVRGFPGERPWPRSRCVAAWPPHRKPIPFLPCGPETKTPPHPLRLLIIPRCTSTPHATGASSQRACGWCARRLSAVTDTHTQNTSRASRVRRAARWMTRVSSLRFTTTPRHGLVPDHTEIVHHPCAIGTRWFQLSVGGGRRWTRGGGEPIWVGAEKAGPPARRCAAGRREIGATPTRWIRRRQERWTRASTSSWLASDRCTRPRIRDDVFETVDQESHAYGPDSPQARVASAGRCRDSVACLRTRSAWTTRNTDLIVVSTRNGHRAAGKCPPSDMGRWRRTVVTSARGSQ